MLGIGIDWAEDFHDIALGTQEKGVIEQFRVDHGPAGVAALIERALRLEPDPAEVRVVLETRHGLLVEALIDAGFTVVPVNPDVVARRRGRRSRSRATPPTGSPAQARCAGGREAADNRSPQSRRSAFP